MTGNWDYMNDKTRDIDLERRNSDRRLRRRQNRINVDVNLLIMTNVNKTCRC